ncbi:MAG TPA: hypothetical protein VJ963_02340 [Bacteroidales bacterium]|nr:hypothetical protein [Bacteroidales bacterium]
MKKVENIGITGMISLIILMTPGCKKSTSPFLKTSQLAITMSKTKIAGTSSVTKSLTSNSSVFTLNSEIVSIADLIVEENTGNDVEQQGNNKGGSDTENKSNAAGTSENGDIHLTGPYIVNLKGQNINIDNITVSPGIFKKVDFSFTVSNDTSLNGNSIIITGTYKNNQGVDIPVVLQSAFNKQIQLPLANGGIVAKSGSVVTLSILFDAQALINNIDLSTAIVSNSGILINNSNNSGLLKKFESNMSSFIEVEN